MLDKINVIVWGTPLLVLLLGTGLLFTVRLRAFQFKDFSYILKSTFFSLFQKDEENRNGTSQLRAVSTSLAAAMGTGNIVGVATAISIGGAGAIFWMWVSAFLGMALVYAENYLATLFRSSDKGGAMAYLEYGTGRRFPAVLFAACCALAAFGMGNMTQSNAISSALFVSLDIPPLWTGLAVALICGLVIIGGAKRIGSVTGIMIPCLAILYFGAALFVIFSNISEVPDVFADIFGSAFGLRQAGGGISGAVIGRAINVGLRRGVFSNEAGKRGWQDLRFSYYSSAR
ncbi:MAG: sodium:alanine symporter family protein [Oscillospiraceae bacterium]|nr:sodium:alanine symporter family protein [Oscillospiraceae bacterium]